MLVLIFPNLSKYFPKRPISKERRQWQWEWKPGQLATTESELEMKLWIWTFLALNLTFSLLVQFLLTMSSFVNMFCKMPSPLCVFYLSHLNPYQHFEVPDLWRFSSLIKSCLETAWFHLTMVLCDHLGCNGHLGREGPPLPIICRSGSASHWSKLSKLGLLLVETRSRHQQLAVAASAACSG